MSVKKTIKSCVVPQCNNSKLSTPNKMLFYVPMNPEKREKWLKAIGLKLTDLSPNVHRYCCEDHFDLRNDAENWVEYSIRKCRIRLKSNVVPHLYDYPPSQRPEFVDVNATTSTSTARTEYETQTSSSETVFCKTNTATLDFDNIPSTYWECKASVIPDKPLFLSKSVQVKPRFRSKYVQCTSVPQ